MLFFNSRARNAGVSGSHTVDRLLSHTVGHYCIVAGCLSIVTGLILIVVGIISEAKQTTYIGIGIVGLAVVFFLTAIVCFYANLDACYNNWAYRARVIPVNIETPQPTSVGAHANSPFSGSAFTAEKRQCSISVAAPSRLTTVSDIEAHRTSISISTQLDPTFKSHMNHHLTLYS